MLTDKSDCLAESENEMKILKCLFYLIMVSTINLLKIKRTVGK